MPAVFLIFSSLKVEIKNYKKKSCCVISYTYNAINYIDYIYKFNKNFIGKSYLTNVFNVSSLTCASFSIDLACRLFQ